MRKLNCWEFKQCGRESGGSNARQLGICPAFKENRLNGAHEGSNAGRSCWVVSGTLCGGEVQGTFAKKFRNCEICDFYRNVKQEENTRFQLSAVLLAKIR